MRKFSVILDNLGLMQCLLRCLNVQDETIDRTIYEGLHECELKARAVRRGNYAKAADHREREIEILHNVLRMLKKQLRDSEIQISMDLDEPEMIYIEQQLEMRNRLRRKGSI